MTTYAIGDVQGCLSALEKLLAHIQFDPAQDTLWFTGDLVNRGQQSLAALRYVKALGNRHQCVLGNHDLHLLAIAHGAANLHHNDTLEEVLKAPDCDELIHWLQHRPLLVQDKKNNYVMTHAGLAAAWSLEKAVQLAHEVETVLRSDDATAFFKHMYGDQPDQWHDQLTGMERLRCITNYFTRMRFCYGDGRLNLTFKGQIADKPAELIPWFQVKPRANAANKIIFGHWAALGGVTNEPNIYALDTGCVWGNCLTAMRLSDEQRFHVPCAKQSSFNPLPL